MKKKFFDDNKYKIYIISGLIVFCALAVTISVFAFSRPKNKITVASSSQASEILTPVALSIDSALFPAVDVEVPTKEPAPEYLRGGENHEIVASIQERLMQLGFMESDEPTTYYGPVTMAAVKVFQRQAGLSADGIVGPETLSSIMDENAKSYSAKLNDSGDDIKNIQQRLYDLGYLADLSAISGNFDEKTDEAVRKFQQRNDIPVDGTVGMQTLNKFYSDDVHANMLAFGEKSDVVLAAQQRLASLGYITSTPDGSYGTDTLEAIKRFQSKNNIVVDGYLGPDTRLALNSDSAMPNSLDLGDSGSQVTNVQNLLVKLNYLKSSQADGYYGESTKSAIEAFQTRNSLSADGKAGSLTLAKLNSSDALKALPVTKAKTNTAIAKNNTSSSTKKNSSSASSTPSPAPASNQSGVSRLLAVASSKLGSPYVWGAKGPNAFDCSGFVYWCLNNSGVGQSYLTSAGWRNVGRYTRISNFSDIQAGDIVVVSGHVGIATGGGGVIDASSSNGRVVSRSLSSWWQNKFIVAWRIF